MTLQQLYERLESGTEPDQKLDMDLSSLVPIFDHFTKYLDAAIAFGKALLGEWTWLRDFDGKWQWVRVLNGQPNGYAPAIRHPTGDDCRSCLMAAIKAKMEIEHV